MCRCVLVIIALALTHPAAALTLPDALARAADVDPSSVIAGLQARKQRIQTAEAWAGLGLTPAVSLSDTIGNTPSGSLSVDLALLNPPSWFSALSQVATADAARATAEATARDARYAVAALWYQAFAAEEAEDLAQTTLTEARGTANAAEARLRAGLASELDAKAARLGVLNAQATLAQAQSTRFIALATLSSALQTEVVNVDVASQPEMPDSVGISPWIAVYQDNVKAAKWAEASSIASLFPTGDISGSTTILPLSPQNQWQIAVSASWAFSGVVNPVLRVETAHIDRTVAEEQLEQQKRSDALAIQVARAQVDAARARRSAAVDGEKLAAETVAVGQARLSAGLISTLDVLKLQEQEALARVQRVGSELDLALAILDSRRLSGLPVLTSSP